MSRLKNIINNLFVILLMLSFGVLTFHFFYLLKSPPEYWIQYYDISPKSEEFLVGEDIYFVSDIEIKRDVSASWTDILGCDYKDGHINYYSLYESANPKILKSERRKTVWHYDAKIPNFETDCILRSYTTLELPLGLKKIIYNEASDVKIRHKVQP